MNKELNYTLNEYKDNKRAKVGMNVLMYFLLSITMIAVACSVIFGNIKIAPDMHLLDISICGLVSALIVYIFIYFGLKKDRICKIVIDDTKDSLITDIKSGGYKPEYKWADILQVKNVKESIIIVLKVGAIIIPKRIFSSEQEINETWDLIQECYGKYNDTSKKKINWFIVFCVIILIFNIIIFLINAGLF